jgi:hypothetical protein
MIFVAKNGVGDKMTTNSVLAGGALKQLRRPARPNSKGATYGPSGEVNEGTKLSRVSPSQTCRDPENHRAAHRAL